MKRITYILLLIMSALTIQAQQLSEESVVSLLTCSPGQPLYFHYGHAAIRIQDPACDYNGTPRDIDWVFNYGIFDFATDGFYWKFVKGETDYMLGLEYTHSFVASSAYYDRHVSYQPLQLSLEERQAIFDALLVNYEPANRYYRYNFVYDNCATRPWQIIKKALSNNEFAAFSESELAQGCGTTWRKATDYYSGKWSWGKYGINLLFGYEADQEMTVEQSLFLPENLMFFLSNHGVTEDEDIQPFVPRDGTFLTSPELLTIILVVLLAALTGIDWMRKRYSWWADEALYVVYLVLGLIITVMFFFSTHPFVGSNMNILFLNPLWLIAIIMLGKPSWRDMFYKMSPWLLTIQACCLVPYIVMGQTLHPILILIFAHSLRLYVLKKYRK